MVLTKFDCIKRAKEINKARQLVKAKKLIRAKRTCLSCNKAFISESAGNRVCLDCKSLRTWEQ